MARDRLWPGLPHQRCTVHKLRNLKAKAPKHVHEAVREGYHRIVYVETLDAAGKEREAFLWKWEKQCPGVAASLEKAGENLLPVSGKPVGVAAHHQRDRANATGVPPPNPTQATLSNEGLCYECFSDCGSVAR